AIRLHSGFPAAPAPPPETQAREAVSGKGSCFRFPDRSRACRKWDSNSRNYTPF
ncbi:hypothetical protein P7K49_000141, partial [Saguinus oedipus]